MNSVLYLTERLRQREHLPRLTKGQHDLSDSLALLVSVQLSAEALLRADPTNAALATLKRFLDGGMITLDLNMRDAAIEDGEQQ